MDDLKRMMKWDLRYLSLAQHVSSWSKDPSTKVGAVIVSPENSIVSVGYNGLPRGVEDTVERLSDRDTKYRMVVHAEINAMMFAERSLKGCTLYTFPFLPCSVCAGQVIQRGISRVISLENDDPRWVDSFWLADRMYKEAGVSTWVYSKDYYAHLQVHVSALSEGARTFAEDLGKERGKDLPELPGGFTSSTHDCTGKLLAKR